MVKYSHHPDGRAHFSQDGKVVTTIRRDAAPLAAQSGHLFSIQIQNLEALSVATATRPEMIRIAAPDEAFALKLVGWRFPEANFRALPPVGTDVPVLIDLGGSQKPAAIRGAPLGVPMSDRVIIVTCELTPRLTSDQDDNLIFVGGFDVTEVALNHRTESGFLAMAYPCSDFDELSRSIGNMDYVAQVAT